MIENNSLTEETIEALENLYYFQKELGVPEQLLKHHEITLSVAVKIVNDLPTEIRENLVTEIIFTGIFLHDIGKVLYPEELSFEGKSHEKAGRDFLLLLGIPDEIANFCISDEINSLEKLISVISDRIWTGVRDIDLEFDLIELVSFTLGKEFWETYAELDGLFEKIAVDSFDKYREFIIIR
ncbi:HD domain-containing protein [Leptospira wolffii]|uniref:HD domain-containing protein n=1 Tax=Leptospira wolffii TaxID=409998 RepID=UPI001438422D|nr:HD domain-containing protein [Leptospira wolffii]